jgi:uncharacterized protein
MTQLLTHTPGTNHVSRSKPDAIRDLFGTGKAVIGVIHCPPLPGSPQYKGEDPRALIEFAVNEGLKYARGGVDGLIVENHGDIPFSKPEDIGPETVSAMAILTHEVRERVGLPTGVNMLANAAIPALGIARFSGAAFVRVNQWANAYVANEGIIEGAAARATRFRSWIHGHGIRIFADVHVKHGAHAIVADRTVPEMARDAEFFDADVLIATGQRTGDAASLDEVAEITSGSALPVVIGSGVNRENVGDILSVASGVIVGSSLKEDGVWWSPVAEEKVAALMRIVEKLR